LVPASAPEIEGLRATRVASLLDAVVAAIGPPGVDAAVAGEVPGGSGLRVV
jgi:hypothetical protein